MDPHFRDKTLGAAYIGSLLASILYGVTSVQIFLYYQNSQGDGYWFRNLILSLWVWDTIHLASTSHGMYHYMVTNFGDLSKLAYPVWSLVAGTYLTNISDIIVRSVFAYRVYQLCGRERPFPRIAIPVVTAILSLLTFVAGAAFATKSFQLVTFKKLHSVSWLLYASFSSSVAADWIIAVSLCVLLFHGRTGVKRTDSLLTRLMAFTINTGLVTSVAALGCLITYAIWPENFIFLGFYFPLSKLYVNALLASLNARDKLRRTSSSSKEGRSPGHIQMGDIALDKNQRLGDGDDGVRIRGTGVGAPHNRNATGFATVSTRILFPTHPSNSQSQSVSRDTGEIELVYDPDVSLAMGDKSILGDKPMFDIGDKSSFSLQLEALPLDSKDDGESGRGSRVERGIQQTSKRFSRDGRESGVELEMEVRRKGRQKEVDTGAIS